LIHFPSRLQTESRDVIGAIPMGDHFDNPKVTLEHFDELARSMITQKSQLTDSHYDRQIREFMFKRTRTYGDDLRAIDIQRGRDHGVASYNEFRRFCGLPVAEGWEGYTDLLASEDVEKLKEVYEDYRDVELSVGALLEAQIDNTTLAGPTLLCIFNKQFLNSRIGDRFWFESGNPEVAFSREQLSEIRKSSFARIYCDNGNNVTSAQLLAFRTVNAER
jgi:peroxidase